MPMSERDTRVEQILCSREYVATHWHLSRRGVVLRERDGAACRILAPAARGDAG